MSEPSASPIPAEAEARRAWTRARQAGPGLARTLAAGLMLEWLALGSTASGLMAWALLNPLDQHSGRNLAISVGLAGGTLLLSSLFPLAVWTLLRWAGHLSRLPRPGTLAVSTVG